MTTSRTVGIVLAAAALTGLAACGSGTAKHMTTANPAKAATTQTTEQPPAPVTYPTPTPSPTQSRDYAAKFGVPYEVTGTAADGVTPISATYTISTPVLDASFYDGTTLPKQGQFVSFNVHIKSTTNGFDYNEWDFYVRGANGAHYDPTSGKDPSFSAGTAHAGELVTGYVTFDAPRHGTLVYAPNFSGEAIGEWVF